MSDTRLEHGWASVGEATLHYVTAGEGAPVVLLHGFPQTWYEWHEVIPRLARAHRVVAPDLRGLGESSRPADGYDKRTVAADVWTLMHDVLGHVRFAVVGHDWGGPVAYALTAAHRDAVTRLAILDVTVPGDGSDVFSTSQGRWHHGFHRTLDLPEALVAGRERLYVTWFLDAFAAHPGAVPRASVDVYVRAYEAPGAMRAGFAYYRAIPRDEADNRASIAQGKLAMPVLALGGTESFARGGLVVESMRRVAEDVRGGVVEGSGHFLPEEAPQRVGEALDGFLGEG